MAIAGIRALGIRDCAVSIPFKETCIPYLDQLEPSAKAIASVNTIVNTKGHLKAYNTDYMAIEGLIEKYQIEKNTRFALRCSGGMAKAVAGALYHKGFKEGIIVARNRESGQHLAKYYGYQ